MKAQHATRKSPDFTALSLRDLVEARNAFHRQLARMENVVGTALGRYLIRKSDPWPPKKPPTGPRPARNLGNSEVRDYSWPCVLVFVRHWLSPSDFGWGKGEAPPGEFIPPNIELNDGRVIPICVVEAPPDDGEPGAVMPRHFPKNLIGGGYPVVAEVQGQSHLASIGCMMTDGHLTYALTNRHVSGAPGEIVYAILEGAEVPIGRSSKKQLTRLPFGEVYPGWPGDDLNVNLDIGLIEIDDKNRWTAQVYGVGELGPLADLAVDTLSLKLIDQPVRAYGCATGMMRGSILGLFYRYKAVSGSEFMADFLIGPREGSRFDTHPGDSGTLWMLEPEEVAEARTLRLAPDDASTRPRPLAVQWGGQRFSGARSGGCAPYVLATGLAAVCRLLDVDVVRDWNTGHLEYWGAVGHYTIAAKACDVIRNKKLKALMKANLERITFRSEDISKKTTTGLSTKTFVPLADVPDLVWKIGKFNRGAPEHPNHFADMDKKDSRGQTLLQICKDPKNVTPARWLAYYNDPKVAEPQPGLLPFRVWQIYDAMVDFVRRGQVAQFACAAGVLSHYVGDSCQPLHISYLHDGDPADSEMAWMRNRQTGKKEHVSVPKASGVHSAYEANMIDYHTVPIMAGLDRYLGKAGRPPLVTGGRRAAIATVQLMQKTFDEIPPMSLVKAYLPLKHTLTAKPAAEALWKKFGASTIRVLGDGSRVLAMLWDSAWKEGGGDRKIRSSAALPAARLATIYQNKNFLRSYTLPTIGRALGH